MCACMHKLAHKVVFKWRMAVQHFHKLSQELHAMTHGHKKLSNKKFCCQRSLTH